MQELRSEFPVLSRIAYLNAGSNGPVPARAVEAATRALREQVEDGRAGGAFFESLIERLELLRARVAALFCCSPDELALTGSTTEGVNTVLAALGLGPGDEVLTSDEEHPGLLAPLAAGARRSGFSVRVVPLGELAAEVGARTRLVAASHVSWIGGRIVDAAALGASDALVLLDGAQGLGAVPVDVRALRCDFYAASGQKWLCGPNGTGYLYLRGEPAAELLPPAPGYQSLVAPERPLELELHRSARRFDAGLAGPHQAAWALASLDVLERPGIDAVLGRAAALAGRVADALLERGAEVAPRGRSTLVSWRAEDPEAETARLAGEGFAVRFMPGRGLVRASVGAWSSEDELDRLAAAATSPP